MRKVSRTGLTVFRIAISATLLIVILRSIDWGQTLSLVENSNLYWWAAALGITVTSIVISAHKWRLVLRSQGNSVPLVYLTSSYFIGLFFNNFFPTSIGGDVYRAYDLTLNKNYSATDASASVVSERVLASITLGFTAAIGLLISAQMDKVLILWVFIFVVLCLGLLYLVISIKSIAGFIKKRQWFYASRFVTKLDDLGDALRAPVNNRRTLFNVLILSLVFQVMVVLVNVAVFKALDIEIHLGYLFIFIPIISALSVLPVSINGLGIREGAYVLFFVPLGLSTTQATAASVGFFISVTLVSLAGGLILVFRRQQKGAL